MRKKVLTIILVVGALACCSLLFCGAAKNERAQINLEINGKTVTYKDEFIKSPNHTVEDEISFRKINAPLSDKLKVVDKCINAGSDWRHAFSYAFPLLPNIIDKVIKDNSLAPIDSIMTFNPDSRPMFKITKEKDGQEINEERLYQEIYMSLRCNAKVKIKVALQPIKAKVTSLDNIKLTNLRSKFSTDYSSSGDERKHNIMLSLSKINGTVLAPGEEFSFNKKVGSRSEKNGFKQAKIIMNNEYVLGFGGGVCQSSTTVYNAAIRADMEVTMVKNHSLTPSYVPPSFDAMVNSSSSDLKFINNTKFPVFIRAVGSSTTASVEFYGAVMPYRIGVKSVEISRSEVPADSEIIDIERKHVGQFAPAGERVRVSYGHAAIKSEGYLVYYDLFGREIERKKIREDYYNKCTGIIAVAPTFDKIREDINVEKIS